VRLRPGPRPRQGISVDQSDVSAEGRSWGRVADLNRGGYVVKTCGNFCSARLPSFGRDAGLEQAHRNALGSSGAIESKGVQPLAVGALSGRAPRVRLSNIGKEPRITRVAGEEAPALRYHGLQRRLDAAFEG